MKKLPEGYKSVTEYQQALAKSGYVLPDSFFASYEVEENEATEKSEKSRRVGKPSETKEVEKLASETK